MPEIEFEPKQQAEQEQSLSEEERIRIISGFEARIKSGELSDRSFHNVVKDELYPLIGNGALGEKEFTRLVQIWAAMNNPHDWVARDSILDQDPIS